MSTNAWKGNNRRKYLLQYHVIFVCKYCKKLLTSKSISSDIKRLWQEICNKHHIVIRHMETDRDHIHYMIETDSTKSLSDIICMMKSYTAYHIWKLHPKYLKKCFWKERTFWTDGYFICSVGNISEKILKEYIENRG